MGDGHHGAWVLSEEALEPAHRFRIEVVGGFVEQQHVRVRQQEAAQGHPAPLSAGELGDVRIPGRQAQGVGGDLEGALEIPALCRIDGALQLPLALEQAVHFVVVHGFGELHGDLVELVHEGLGFSHALFNVAAHVLARVELRLLGQVAHLDIGLGPGLAVKLPIHPRHDAQEGGFSRAIQTEHADFGAGEKGQGDVF